VPMVRAIAAYATVLLAIHATGCSGGNGGGGGSGGSGGSPSSTTGSGGGTSTASTGGTGGTSSTASTGGDGGGGATSSSSSGTGGAPQPVCPPLGQQNYVAMCSNTNGVPCSQWGDICMNGQCICDAPNACKPFTAIACDQNLPGDIAVDATHVYWLTGHPFGFLPGHQSAGPVGVMKAPKGGGNTVVLAGNELSPTSLVVDATHAYWTSGGEDAVKRVPIAGGNVQLLVNGQKDPISLATDGVSLYWIADGAVRKMPLAGGNPVTLVSGAPPPVALTVDGGQVYYATNDGAAIGNSTILSVPAAGGNPTVLAAGQTNTAELVVQGGYVYWTNRGNGGVPNGPTGSVARVPTAGGVAQTLSGGPTLIGGGITVDGSNAYWAVGNVLWMPIGGGSFTFLAKSQGDPSGIAADATHVYWTDRNSGFVLVMDK
jgi:hypothetical protein